MRQSIWLALFALMLASCAQATEEDRKALVGLWQPEDGSRHTVEFKDNTEFDFVYDAGPPRTVLRLNWELDRKGRVNIKRPDGSIARTCYYTVTTDRLEIDNGSGAECLRSAATPTTLMPRSFRRESQRP